MVTLESNLYVVATPLGNKEDVTLRALSVFRQEKIFFAEDSRELRKLMGLHGVSMENKIIHSYAKHNLRTATEKALEYLSASKSVVLVCDRGTPGISDPGAQLVAQARLMGAKVLPIPGASAVTALMSVSGFDGTFTFVGFLPHTQKSRDELWNQSASLDTPVCFFESPQRVRETAKELKNRFPSGMLFWGREMTKVFEQYEKASLADLDLEALPEKGEYTILLLPGKKTVDDNDQKSQIEQAIRLRTCSEKDWAKHLGEKLDLPAKEIYNQLQRAKNLD